MAQSKLKKDYYKALGVDKNASPEQIKRAYRAKARKVHPDKGGDGSEMAEISKAYACLSSPVARLTYDQTGEGPALDNCTEKAYALLMQIFLELIRANVDDNLKGRMLHALNQDRDALRTKIQAIKVDIRRFEKYRFRFTVSQGVNLWENLIDDQVREETAVIAHIEAEMEVRTKALGILQHYEEKSVASLFSVSFNAGTMSSATGTIAW